MIIHIMGKSIFETNRIYLHPNHDYSKFSVMALVSRHDHADYVRLSEFLPHKTAVSILAQLAEHIAKAEKDGSRMVKVDRDAPAEEGIL